MVFLQYLSTVFDNLRDTILLVGVEPKEQYRLLLANEAFRKHTGHLKSDTGKLLSDIVLPDTYRVMAKHYNRAIHTKELVEFSGWFDVPLGRRAYEVKVIPILNAMSECVQLAVITHDVSELYTLRDRLMQIEHIVAPARQEP